MFGYQKNAISRIKSNAFIQGVVAMLLCRRKNVEQKCQTNKTAKMLNALETPVVYA